MSTSGAVMSMLMNLFPHLLHPQPNSFLVLYTDHIPDSKIKEKIQAMKEMRVHVPYFRINGDGCRNSEFQG